MTATILASQTSVVVPLDVLDDGVVYGDRTVIATIAQGNYEIVSENEATIVLHDNPQAIKPLVTIAATDDYAMEPDPESSDPIDTATFIVTRTGDTSQALTVYYSIGGTATPDTDYEVLTGSVTIAAGESSATITVTPLVLAQEPADPDEMEHTLEITLVNAPNPADYKVPAETSGGWFARAIIAARNALTTAQATLISMTYSNSMLFYNDPKLTSDKKGIVDDVAYSRTANLAAANADTTSLFAYAVGQTATVRLTF